MCQKVAKPEDRIDLSLCHFKAEIARVLYHFRPKPSSWLDAGVLQHNLGASQVLFDALGISTLHLGWALVPWLRLFTERRALAGAQFVTNQL